MTTTTKQLSSITTSAWKVIPQFTSLSIKETVDFYTRVLGFFLGGVHPEDESSELIFCSVAMGKKAAANIYFYTENVTATGTPTTAEGKGTDADGTPKQVLHPSTAWIALGTEELEQYYNLLRSNAEVVIAEQIEDKPWGYKQFTIRDPHGNRLVFFRFLEGGNPGTEETETK